MASLKEEQRVYDGEQQLRISDLKTLIENNNEICNTHISNFDQYLKKNNE